MAIKELGILASAGMMVTGGAMALKSWTSPVERIVTDVDGKGTITDLNPDKIMSGVEIAQTLANRRYMDPADVFACATGITYERLTELAEEMEARELPEACKIKGEVRLTLDGKGGVAEDGDLPEGVILLALGAGIGLAALAMEKRVLRKESVLGPNVQTATNDQILAARQGNGAAEYIPDYQPPEVEPSQPPAATQNSWEAFVDAANRSK